MTTPDSNLQTTTPVTPKAPKPTPTKPTSVKPTAARPTPSNQGATVLKTTLVAGGILATLLGANLAARQDQLAAAPVITTSYATTTQGTQSVATLPNLPGTANLGSSDVNALLNMPLAPIPSIAIPTVTRSRSSR